MRQLAGIPLLHQPGAGWTYNTGSDILGVLIARAAGQPLPEFLREQLFDPLAMTDTGFDVPGSQLSRFTTYYHRDPPGGALSVADEPGGEWATPPRFPSGAGGLVSTAADWLAFGRMLLDGGVGPHGRLLSESSVRLITTNVLDPKLREANRLFLDGQGWGFGGSVDVDRADPWTVPGRYGWVGGTGTAAHIVPSTGTVTVLLTQVAMTDPEPPSLMHDFWTAAAG